MVIVLPKVIIKDIIICNMVALMDVVIVAMLRLGIKKGSVKCIRKLV